MAKRTLWKRIILDLVVIAFFYWIPRMIAAVSDIFSSEDKWIPIGFALIGLVLSEYKSIKEWVVNIFKTAGILIKQKVNPEDFIEPYFQRVDLFPDPLKGIEQDYIEIVLSWKNQLFTPVTIEDIKGSISIDGSDPPDALPPNIDDILLEPLREPLNPTPILVTITKDTFKIVRQAREDKHRKGSLALKLSVKINGHKGSYHVPYTYHYVA